MLDVPRHVLEYLSHLLAGQRRTIGTPKGSRAVGTFRQAVLVLRWFRERACGHCLARDTGISQATAYRYLHEGIDVLATQARDLHPALEHCKAEGMSHVVLDGMLIGTDRLAGTVLSVKGQPIDEWYSGKHSRFGGNVQFLSSPDGSPLWVGDVEPGSTHDLAAVRIHALPALYAAAADGLPTLADAGYEGAGIGVHVPVKRPAGKSSEALHADTRTPTTRSCVGSGRWVNEPPPNSRSGGGR